MLVKRYQNGRYYKKLFSWEQLILMLYGVLSRCNSIGELCDSMRALGGKLNYLGMENSPAKSINSLPSSLKKRFGLLLE